MGIQKKNRANKSCYQNETCSTNIVYVVENDDNQCKEKIEGRTNVVVITTFSTVVVAPSFSGKLNTKRKVKHMEIGTSFIRGNKDLIL